MTAAHPGSHVLIHGPVGFFVVKAIKKKKKTRALLTGLRMRRDGIARRGISIRCAENSDWIAREQCRIYNNNNICVCIYRH